MENIEFKQQLNHYQKIVDKELQKFLNGLRFLEEKNPLVKKEIELLKSFCLSPGKRLRPIMVIMGFKAVCQRPEREVFLPAISPELYHNCALIYDDIYDEDKTRRGEITPHFFLKEWFKKRYKKTPYFGTLYKDAFSRLGIVSSFTIGNILKTLVNSPILYSNISEKKKIKIFKVMRELSLSENFGQSIDLFFEKERKITERDYFEMVNLKTSGLFKSSLTLGAILGGGSESQIKCFKNYAENLGHAFQIKDDLLDLSIGGDKGRGMGSDIKKGKKTILLIRALKKTNLKDRKILKNVVGNEKASKKEIKKAINVFYKTGAVGFCEKVSSEKIKRAISWLKKAKPKFYYRPQKFLESLAYFSFERKR